MADNLVSMFARRCANGAATVLVYAGAGVAMALLVLFGYAPSVAGRRQSATGLLGLLVVVGVVAGGLLLESAIVTGEWPRLLRGGRPW